MVTAGRILLTVLAERVAALIASGDGTPFDSAKGTPPREWFA